MLNIFDLVTEYQKNPIGLDETNPRFSWKIRSDKENVMQTAYHIIVDGVWDSGKIMSDESVHIEYNGLPLEPKTSYIVKVKIWDSNGDESSWEEASFETGFLGEKLWDAKWLRLDNLSEVVPVFVKKFNVAKPFEKARLYATSYGIYDVFINGRKASDIYLTPGFTSYKKRLQYQTYATEDLVTVGENTIEIYLSKGWCCGRYPFQHNNNPYKMNPSVLAQLEIDGNVAVATDESWNCFESKLRFAEIYDGETYDNTFNSKIPVPFSVADYGYDNIIGQISEPVRIIETLKPVELITTPKGENVIDFGQNMVGFINFKVCSKKGERVVLSHAEVLDRDGNFYTDNLRTAKQRIEYISNGEPEEYHSKMTFQGFRYIRIDEYPGEVDLNNFEAHVICTDMKRTGYFKSSHQLLNKLYENVIWGQKGNFVDIPTDCPQRDERAGWTGDAQVFCKTAAQNMNTALFFKKWLGDLSADQTEDGCCLIIVPSIDEMVTSSGWGDAAVICPWDVYMTYGDKKLLSEQYPAMKKWIEYIKAQGDNPYLWNTGHHFGDWLALDMPDTMRGATSHDFIASAYYAYSTSIVKRAADVLGLADDSEYFGKLYDKIIENFENEFITPNGRVCENTQTAQAIALKFNLAKNKERVAKALATLVENNANRLTTGFLGTPYLCDALFENGYPEKAYDLLLQEKYPSWLYSVKMGATTIWEHWDGIKPDGTFWSCGMNSYNHYAYGAIADFMYKKTGGISQKAPGYKKIHIEPSIDDRITSAEASVDTVYGVLSSSWKTEGDSFELTVTIPCNTTADIVLPDGSEYSNYGSGTYTWVTKIAQTSQGE